MIIQIFELRFLANLDFFEIRSKIGKPLEKIFKHWQYDATSLKFFDADKKVSTTLECKRILLVGINQDNGSFKKFVQDVYSSYFKIIPVEKIIRFGYRVHASIEIESSFEEAVKLFEERVYPQTDNFKKIFPENFIDVAFVGDFKRKELLFHLATGPVTKEECSRRMKENNPFEYAEDISDTSLYIDIDAFKENFNASELDNHLDLAFDQVDDIKENIFEFSLK